jgi:hypothetical protein
MFFLYHRTTRPTGEVLGEALGIPHGTEVPSDRQDVLIRWGATGSVPYQAELTINPANAIERATHKLNSFLRMSQRGIVVPRFSEVPGNLRAPFLSRSINHTRGQDIGLCMQLGDAAMYPSADFFVEYVPVAREYRARVVGDECVRVSEKVLTDDTVYTPWIRNYEHGHTFVSPRTRLNAFQESLAIAAVKAHGLHFGAVDLVVGDDGHTYVLEVNTAPALAPRSAAAMLGGIARLIETERPGTCLDVNFNVLDRLTSTDDGDTEDDTDNLIEF